MSGSGFWQVHPAAADTLVAAVLRMLDPRPGEHALDLYSGVGLFSAALALAVGDAGSVVAVEAGLDAVGDARRNLHDLPSVRLVEAQVEEWLRRPGLPACRRRRPRPAALRRAAAGRRRGSPRSRPRAIAYVACDPAALARDLAYFRDEGYQLAELEAYDLFPMTHHVECVARSLRRAGWSDLTGPTRQDDGMTVDLRDAATRHDEILRQRLDEVVPLAMERADLDVWVIIGREYAEGPVLRTMLPATWINARRRTVLVFRRDRTTGAVERLAVARYDIEGLYPSAWDPEVQPDQWARIAEVVAEGDPRRIGVDTSDVLAHADGLTATEHAAFEAALPTALRDRLVPGRRSPRRPGSRPGCRPRCRSCARRARSATGSSPARCPRR